MEVKIEPLEEKKVQMKELEEKEEIGEKKEAKKDLADMMSTTRRAGEDPIESEPMCCYRDKATGVLSWQGLSCKEWGAVTAVFIVAYILLALSWAALFAAQTVGQTETLIVYAIVFLAFVIFLSIVVAIGECNRAKESLQVAGAKELNEVDDEIKASVPTK